MASIWTQGPGCPPEKLQGHLPPMPEQMHLLLLKWAGKLAKANNAKVVSTQNFEVHLQWPDGARFTVFAEFYSPPSAPEEGQPKLFGDGGVLLCGGKAYALEKPHD